MPSSKLSQQQVMGDRIIHLGMLACLLGIFVIQIVYISGGGTASHTLAARAQQLLSAYPEGQVERSVRQTLSIVENLHVISSRAKFLLENVDSADIQGIAKRFESLKDEDIRNTMSVFANLNTLLSRVNAEDVGQVVKNTREISSALNATRLNELIEATKTIEKRLNDLHEIRIKI